MPGTLVITTLSDGTNSTSSTNCIQGSAKAWVNFNGTTASPSTIRGSYNVTSVTKGGTGDYTVNFTNALTDNNYACFVSSGQGLVIANTNSDTTAPTTTAQRLRITNTSANFDTTYVYFGVFR